MLQLTTTQLTIGLGVTALLALVALLLTLASTARLRRLRRHYSVLRGEADESDLISLARSWRDDIVAVNRRVDEMAISQAEVESVSRLAIRSCAVVRYDAFRDMGGRLSFSAALLDANGDGMLLTSINGRQETRTYGKAVKNHESEHDLSDEERQALDEAASATRGRPRPAVSR